MGTAVKHELVDSGRPLKLAAEHSQKTTEISFPRLVAAQEIFSKKHDGALDNGLISREKATRFDQTQGCSL